MNALNLSMSIPLWINHFVKNIAEGEVISGQLMAKIESINKQIQEKVSTFRELKEIQKEEHDISNQVCLLMCRIFTISDLSSEIHCLKNEIEELKEKTFSKVGFDQYCHLHTIELEKLQKLEKENGTELRITSEKLNRLKMLQSE